MGDNVRNKLAPIALMVSLIAGLMLGGAGPASAAGPTFTCVNHSGAYQDCWYHPQNPNQFPAHVYVYTHSGTTLTSAQMYTLRSSILGGINCATTEDWIRYNVINGYSSYFGITVTAADVDINSGLPCM